MEGRATGQHQAIRLKYLRLEDAIDLDNLLGAIMTHGNGNGQVTTFVLNHGVGDMEMVTRVKRKPRKIHLQQAS